MLPRWLRDIFYKILRSGSFGLFLANCAAWGFYWTVKLLRIPPQQDKGGLTVISHRYKFIFFGIPKVASRSFYHYFIIQHEKDFECEWVETRNGFQDAAHRYPDYFKFSFVRSPWARIASCYSSKIADNIIGKRARILSFYQGLKGGMPFDDFIAWLLTPEGRDEIADRHWMSQYLLLSDEHGNIMCDVIGKYETLEEDWKNICSRIGLPYEPLQQKGFVTARGKTENPALKQSKTKEVQTADTRAYFTQDSWEKVYKRYQKDIEYFGYQNEKL